MSKDPWKHRSSGMKCSTCMFFVEKVVATPTPSERYLSLKPTYVKEAFPGSESYFLSEPGKIMRQQLIPDDPESFGPKFGRCRRHAPSMNGYPAVFATDWCGDHKLDENKI